MLNSVDIFEFVKMSFIPWTSCLQDLFNTKLHAGVKIDMQKILSPQNLEFIIKFIEKELYKVNKVQKFPIEWVKLLGVMCRPGKVADRVT